MTANAQRAAAARFYSWYIEKRMSIPEIARMEGTNHQSVSALLKFYGYPVRRRRTKDEIARHDTDKEMNKAEENEQKEEISRKPKQKQMKETGLGLDDMRLEYVRRYLRSGLANGPRMTAIGDGYFDAVLKKGISIDDLAQLPHQPFELSRIEFIQRWRS